MDMRELTQKRNGCPRSFFFHFITSNVSSTPSKNAATFDPWSSRSVVLKTRQIFAHFRNGEDNLLHRPIVTDNFYLRRVIGVVLQSSITANSVYWWRFNQRSQFFIVLRKLMAQNLIVVSDFFRTSRLFTANQLLMIGFTGIIH